ncbi:hypothetical protein [Synechococcus phage S-B05]|nr:hypothetical protein [Synechococcus phage S-B05]
MTITSAKFTSIPTNIDGTPIINQVLVSTQNSDGTVSTHRYPESEELNLWVAEGNTITPADSE